MGYRSVCVYHLNLHLTRCLLWLPSLRALSMPRSCWLRASVIYWCTPSLTQSPTAPRLVRSWSSTRVRWLLSVPKHTSTVEKSEIEEKVADALEENFEKHDIVARAHTGDNTEEESEEDEIMEGEQTGDKMETDAEKADAEVGNLEQAWQMFDLAKVIYGRTGDVTKECESLTFLGEVSLENSNFKQAVEDLSLCLAKRIKALPADSRSIAESQYQLGVAQAHCAEYTNAEKSLEAAVTVLNARIVNLQKMEASDHINKELAELALLCTEIKERAADHKEMEKGTYKEDKDFCPSSKEWMRYTR